MADELVYLNVMWGRIDAAGRWHPNPYLTMTADEQRRDNIARGLLPPDTPDSRAPDPARHTESTTMDMEQEIAEKANKAPRFHSRAELKAGETPAILQDRRCSVKKLKSIIASHGLTAYFLALVVAGYPFGIVGAQNLAALFALALACMLPLQFIALSDSYIKSSAKERGAPLETPIMKRLMMFTAIVIAAWHGALWTASGAMLWLVLGIVWTRLHNTAVDEIKAEEAIKAATRTAV